MLRSSLKQENQGDLDNYSQMQKNFYKSLSYEPNNIIVGHYDFHENVPYETHLLYMYGDLRRPIFDDFHSKRAFEICCGEGRMVRRFQNIFSKVDGADISEEMIGYALQRTQGSEFWVTNGQGCGDAPSSMYDFVYCTISMQHICVFEIRDMIMKDVMRILKPEGKITFQYLFSKDFPFVQVNDLIDVSHIGENMAVKGYNKSSGHASWHDNLTYALGTNSACDVVFGENDIGLIKEYFSQYFKEVEIWFHDISIGRGGFGQPRILEENHPNSHKDNKYHGTHLAFIHLSGRRDI
jgi:ubiquinone/menaquinone biosynthesis C-methylase UbiE